MKVQYRLTEDDYAHLARFHAWRNLIARPSATQLVLGSIIVALLGISLWTSPSIAPSLAFVIAVFAIMFAVSLLVGTPWRARRHYRQYKSIQEPLTVELTEAGIKFASVDGEANMPRSKVFQWRQTDRFILIYGMPIMYHVVPKSIEREGFDVPLLVQRLSQHVGPER